MNQTLRNRVDAYRIAFEASLVSVLATCDDRDDPLADDDYERVLDVVARALEQVEFDSVLPEVSALLSDEGRAAHAARIAVALEDA